MRPGQSIWEGRVVAWGFRAVFALALLGCEPDQVCPAEVPADFECPVEVGPFEVGACGITPDSPNPTPLVELSVDGSALRVHIETLLFRDNNEICGFAELENTTIRLLLQPCALVSVGGVSSGDCWYTTVDFEIDEIDIHSATDLRIFHRVDEPADMPSQTPEQVADVPLP